MVIHNDHYTPISLVVECLEHIFDKNAFEAERLMQEAHSNGLALIGIYSKEIAETKIQQAAEYVKDRYPLRFLMRTHELKNIGYNMILEEVKRVDEQAAGIAQKKSCVYITLEHLFIALLKTQETLDILTAHGVDLSALKSSLRLLHKQIPKSKEPSGLPTRTAAFNRVIERACSDVQSSGRNRVTASDLLVSLLEEPDSPLVYRLQKLGLTHYKLLCHLTSKESDIGYTHPQPESNDLSAEPLAAYTVNLTLKARNGEIDPLIGREEELSRTCCILSRRRKNHPLLVGEPGIGKTAIIEGLAYRIEHGEIDGFAEDFEIYTLDIGLLMAGTMFRGMMEKRLNGLLDEIKKRPHAVLFIDEIHMIVGAGASLGSSLDIANLLKPLLSSGEIRVIGATTPQEFRQSFENDKALRRRFQKVQVEALDKEQTLTVLQGLVQKYEQFHGVTFPQNSLQLAVDLADRYLTHQHFPDKAIDIIDEAGALMKRSTRLNPESRLEVSPAVVRQVISIMTNVPRNDLTESEFKAYGQLEHSLQQSIFGQDHAIRKICDAMVLSRSGLVQQESPIGSFLCVGPPGVGKTSMAREIAASLGIHFERFDMSEYMEEYTVSRLIGSPPGYEGHHLGGLLTEAVNRHPHAVLLLDEIEKAHPKILNVFLQVMDYGVLTDTGGVKVDFKNVILLMSSNVGSTQKQAIGIANTNANFTKLDDAVKECFSAEFRNRLTEVIRFNSLTPDLIRLIVDRHIWEIETALSQKNIRLETSKEAKTWLLKNGYAPEQGARPVKNLVRTQILNTLSKKLLVDGFKRGTVAISVQRDQTGLKTEFRREISPAELSKTPKPHSLVPLREGPPP